MKKKIVFLAVTALLIGSFAACGESNSQPAQTAPVAEEPAASEPVEDLAPAGDEKPGVDGDLGFGDETPAADGELIGGKLCETFLAEAENASDLKTLAESIAAVSGYDCAIEEVQEGFLNGFSEEISGFSAGSCFMPWIGSIPLVGYVFETEDPDALVETLLAKADPRWNICTEAAETVYEISGNKVFFAMCPGPDEF